MRTHGQRPPRAGGSRFYSRLGEPLVADNKQEMILAMAKQGIVDTEWQDERVAQWHRCNGSGPRGASARTSSSTLAIFPRAQTRRTSWSVASWLTCVQYVRVCACIHRIRIICMRSYTFACIIRTNLCPSPPPRTRIERFWFIFVRGSAIVLRDFGSLWNLAEYSLVAQFYYVFFIIFFFCRLEVMFVCGN